MQDIYFDDRYGKLYEKAEHGKAVCWQYTGPEGCVKHQFILREIPIEMEGRPWYDIVTPYGYGGPVIESVAESSSREALVQAFQRAFSQYCFEQRIVAEFVRFHPLIRNAEDFAKPYQAACIRHTLGTNLKDYDDPIVAEFSKSCRKSIRQALRKGVTWRITACPKQIDVFKEIYYATMDRNSAGDYYYFDEEYFTHCLEWFWDRLLFVEAVYEEKTIAAGLYFISGTTIHIHLSGTRSEYLHLSPAYVLRYAAALWGKEHGYHVIHHGGGRSNARNDQLFAFKKQFAQVTEFEFWVGRKIWNPEIYNALCEIHGTEKDSAFFPAYRA